MKRCSKCGVEKELTEFHRNGMGHVSQCKLCKSEHDRILRESKKTDSTSCTCGCGEIVKIKQSESKDNRFIHGHYWKLHDPKNHPNYRSNPLKRVFIDGIEGKVCPKCKEWKKIDEFYLIAVKGKKVRNSRCNECVKEKARKWSKSNPEKHRIAAKRQREKDPSKNYKKVKAWRKTHKLNRLQEARRYRKKNPHVGRANIKRWRDKNYEKILAYNHQRRAIRNGVEGKFSKDEWYWLFALCGRKCVSCGASNRIHKDHIIPISRNGTNFIENMQPLCFSCNSKKGITAIDFRPVWIGKNFNYIKGMVFS